MLPFEEWKRHLLASAGTASPAVSGLGDFVLALFYRDGCEPTLSGLLYYALAGLHPVEESARPGRTGVTILSP